MTLRTDTHHFVLDSSRSLFPKPPASARTFVGMMMLGLIGGERSAEPLMNVPLPALERFGL